MDVFYYNSLLVSWVLLFFFAFDLIVVSAPKEEAYCYYNRSRKMLGGSFFVLGVQVFLQWFFCFRETAPHIATALNLTGYYIMIILFAMAFISLLNPSYISRNRIIWDFSKCFSVLVLVWCTTLLFEGTVQRVAAMAGAAFFFIDTLRLLFLFLRIYYDAKRETENYTSEELEDTVTWIFKSCVLIGVLGLMGSFFVFAPQTANGVFMCMGTVLAIYAFMSFQRFILNYLKVREVVADNASSQLDLEDWDVRSILGETIQKKENVERKDVNKKDFAELEKRTRDWVEHKGFLQSGLTVGMLALELGTNRTEMSSFVNTEYKCNFREWISSMRIEEAKSMLLTNNLSVEQVSVKCGFSSSSFFIKQFTKATGESPAKWKRSHRPYETTNSITC